MNTRYPLIALLLVAEVSAVEAAPRPECSISADQAAQWDSLSVSRESLRLPPEAVAVSSDASLEHLRSRARPLQLVMKRYRLDGARPVLLVHGLAMNDLAWDPPLERYSFARFLHAQGFDVWLANLRGAGSRGFTSDRGPDGQASVEDFAIHDLPALISTIQRETHQSPFLVGHSMGAWIFEGYFAGLDHGADGSVVARQELGKRRQAEIPAAATVAGIYSLWWPKSLDHVFVSPVRSKAEYYQSNYELELLVKNPAAAAAMGLTGGMPMGWVGAILDLPLQKIPVIGGQLKGLYGEFWHKIAATRLLNMFYHAPNLDPEVVRLLGVDGLEDMSRTLLLQFKDALENHRTTSVNRGYEYRSVRSTLRVPMLFVAGDRDRLANMEMIRTDGFEATRSPIKKYIVAAGAGHADILVGRNAARDVMFPVSTWFCSRPAIGRPQE